MPFTVHRPPAKPGAARFLKVDAPSLSRAVVLPLALPLILIVAGASGYRAIEGWPAFDCLYMAVITLTTVGFGEVHPLSHAGRWFTMGLSLGGIFTIFFAATEVLRAWASGQLQDLLAQNRLKGIVDGLRDHVIICGHGRMGRLVAAELSQAHVPFVAIDASQEALADFVTPSGVALHGDATSDAVLLRAGLPRARAVVAALGSDADNLFITMSARLLDERLPIVARAENEGAAAKLRRAGATRVVAPYVIGGARVAQAILRPSVLDFIEVATRTEHIELQLEEVVVAPGARLAGRALGACALRTKHNVIVVAIEKRGRPTVFNPPDDAVLDAGDTLVMLGHRERLDEVEVLAGSVRRTRR